MKTAIKKLAPFAARLISTRLIQSWFGNFVPIFMLHRLEHPDYGVKGDSAEDIRSHLEYFRKRGFQALSLERLGEILAAGEQPPKKSAVFTIDDGYIDHHDIAGPLFAEFDIPLTYFVITGMLDGELWPWNDQIGYAIERAAPGNYECDLNGKPLTICIDEHRDRRDERHRIDEYLKTVDNNNLYQMVVEICAQLRVDVPVKAPPAYTSMSWDQANSLVDRGHCVAAHTHSHRILSQLNDEESKREISSSVARVKEMVHQPSNVFAFPTGRPQDYTERDIGFISAQNIPTCVSTVCIPAVVAEQKTPSDLLQLPRVPLPASEIDFIQYLSWIEYAKHSFRSRYA